MDVMICLCAVVSLVIGGTKFYSIAKWHFSQTRHFKCILLYLKTILHEEITLDQHIYFYEDITTDLRISSPWCILE